MKKLNGMKDIPCEHLYFDKYLRQNFKVHRSLADLRHDEGDDSGFHVAISEDKEGTIFLQIVMISYNGSIYDICLCEEDYQSLIDSKRYNNVLRDFIVCDSIEDAQSRLSSICDDMKKFYEYDEDMYFWDLWDEYSVDNGFKEIIDKVLGHDMSEEMCGFYCSLSTSYFEYLEEEDKALRDILNPKYEKYYRR